MPDYQDPLSQQTLEQGRREYFEVYAEQLTRRVTSPEAEAFFRCHDTVHVVFGCGLSLADEAVVKISSFFGTNGGSAVWRGYRLPESKEIYTEIGFTDIVTTAAKSLVIVPKTIWHCSRMDKRWPWQDFEAFMDIPLVDIRREFNIRLITT